MSVNSENSGGRSQADLGSVLSGLTEAINTMNIVKVPPPATYSGAGRIEDFFVDYERYCKVVYKQDFVSYLALLPSFLDGEPKRLVDAFGRGQSLTYQEVKQRMIKELSDKKVLGGDPYAQFFGIQRQPEESLACYVIRLETAAKRIGGITEDGEKSMVRSKLISSLPESMVQQMKIQMAHMESVGIEHIVRTASILERQAKSVATVAYNSMQ